MCSSFEPYSADVKHMLCVCLPGIGYVNCYDGLPCGALSLPVYRKFTHPLSSTNGHNCL